MKFALVITVMFKSNFSKMFPVKTPTQPFLQFCQLLKLRWKCGA